MKNLAVYLFALLILIFPLFSCEAKESDPIPDSLATLQFTTKTEKMIFKVDTLHTGFQNPWGMTWINTETLLVTEKKGELLIFKKDSFSGQKVTGLPAF
jgi:glucose/arabinose dehydrogenase